MSSSDSGNLLAVSDITKDQNVDRPVFIIGGSRTGSEMLKTMLSKSEDLDFVDELFLLCPIWLHTDLRTNIRKYVGKLDQPDAVDRLIDLFFSKKLYGWFWNVVDDQLDRESLREEMLGKPVDMRSLFLAIMVVHARRCGKSCIGAKFPLHYSYTNKLIEWFPNCRLIHTTRLPKAVYASQAAKYIDSDQSYAAKMYLRFKQFVHINIQTAWTARIHDRYCDMPNYRLVRYEDVVREPEVQIRAICEFLEVESNSLMLAPEQYGSSFRRPDGSAGVNRNSLERWRGELSSASSAWFDTMQNNANKKFGYRVDS